MWFQVPESLGTAAAASGECLDQVEVTGGAALPGPPAAPAQKPGCAHSQFAAPNHQPHKHLSQSLNTSSVLTRVLHVWSMQEHCATSTRTHTSACTHEGSRTRIERWRPKPQDLGGTSKLVQASKPTLRSTRVRGDFTPLSTVLGL